MKTYTPSQISAIARLFSPGVVREMACGGKSPMFSRLAKEAIGPTHSMGVFVGNFFDACFDILRRSEYRHEYVYKQALTHEVLLGRHSLQTASMLTEFRVASCKADVSILNGTSTVYEIKSERDSLKRLENQIQAYIRFFAKVYVIAGENHTNAIESLVPDDVGILTLSKDNCILAIREAQDRPERTCPLTIFESIRTGESQQILKLFGLRVPEVPNTMMHAALREEFGKLNPRQAHDGMVQVLKRTRNLLPLSTLLEAVPHSLQSAALTVPLNRREHGRLVSALQTTLQHAMEWS